MIEIKKSIPNEELLKLQKQAKDENLTADQAYELLRNPLKNEIINQLIGEQGKICAYCMRRIPDERTNNPKVKIEHWEARNGKEGKTCGPEGALYYYNMLAVCSGNQNDKSKPRNNKLTCDASRGNENLTVNPMKPATLVSIFYTEDGYIDASDSEIKKDLQETLNLNCMRDSVRLPKERKEVLDTIQLEISDNLEQGVDIGEFCKNLYKELSKDSEKIPYVGIALWCLKEYM